MADECTKDEPKGSPCPKAKPASKGGVINLQDEPVEAPQVDTGENPFLPKKAAPEGTEKTE